MDNKQAKIYSVELGGAGAELDLHGLRVFEAEEKIESFLFACQKQKTDVAKIIYGVGTGALERGVVDYLKNHPLVDGLVLHSGYCIVLF